MKTDNSSAAPARWAGVVGLATFVFPGMCPACWPTYLGLLSSVGVGTAAPLLSSMWLFLPLVIIGVLPLLWPLVRRREWDGVLATVTGAALLVEARWIGGSIALHGLGVLILIATAVVTNRPACAAAPLIQIGRR